MASSTLLVASCGARASLMVRADRAGAGGEAGAGVGAHGGTGAQGGGGNTGTGATGAGGALPGSCPSASDGMSIVAVVAPNGSTTCIDAWEITRGQYEIWLGTSPDPAQQPARPARAFPRHPTLSKETEPCDPYDPVTTARTSGPTASAGSCCVTGTLPRMRRVM